MSDLKKELMELEVSESLLKLHNCTESEVDAINKRLDSTGELPDGILKTATGTYKKAERSELTDEEINKLLTLRTIKNQKIIITLLSVLCMLISAVVCVLVFCVL